MFKTFLSRRERIQLKKVIYFSFDNYFDKFFAYNLAYLKSIYIIKI